MATSSIDKDLFKAPQRKSSVDTVIETIEHLLLSRRIKPGDKLPNEMELTKSLSTSRGSIREAMKILASYGIVEIKRGDGTYVSRSLTKRIFDQLLFQLILSDHDKQRLIELRELIEIGIVRIVVQNASEEDLRAVRDVYDEMERQVRDRVQDARLLTKCDLDFHLAIARATKNNLIEKIYSFTLDLFAPSIEDTHRDEQSGLNTLRLHKKILEGLVARDQKGAEQAVKEAIDTWSQPERMKASN